MGGPSGELLAALQTSVSDVAGSFRIERTTPVAGGCVHRSFILEGGGRKYFAKINERSQFDSFAAEAEGLAALAAAGARVPAPLCRGQAHEHAFLVLEHLELRGNGDYAALGRSLAAVHSVHGAAFGWHRDNYIGRTAQLNRRSASWSDFWREARLGPQLELARKNRLGRDLVGKGERLAEALPRLLSEHAPAASLLHGDLWSGNAGFLAGGAPVLFDPAVYWGDREADLAMTELFGGFPQAFYAAYAEVAPLAQGYAVRKTLYNLYHVLNHANLFGGGYAAQAKAMIERLLAELR
ncbi:MAG: fructosamine kinase family protein [Betaproteobacteria bacterium]|nr:MAG: fructosamine kinase family protein [Betaproteobacteria bacterium]